MGGVAAAVPGVKVSNRAHNSSRSAGPFQFRFLRFHSKLLSLPLLGQGSASTVSSGSRRPFTKASIFIPHF
ncbi:unnamed protein product [Nezara viridula]|uniref:Uncharacterized protein n=1 Tax=Nezara viridula TaxID=85310 RepID=A0A9P0MZM6_NEZVI|nr:unnamed protein product [Nezara viridula]